MSLNFDLSFEPAYGEPVTVFPGVSRVTAKNPSPFTFHGTNSYLVGEHGLAIIDPGPENDEHFDALIGAVRGRPVSHIFVSHTHRDHSPLAARLSSATGAKVYAEGPHRPARNQPTGTPLDNGADTDFVPDVALADGDLLAGDGWTLRIVLTPGHTANHAAFALEGTGLLFSGDHVMGWSTTIVAPPDGSMSDYMASLDRLIARDDRLLLPGHGGPVNNPSDYHARPQGAQAGAGAGGARSPSARRPVDRRAGQGDIPGHRSENARRRSAFGAGASGGPGRQEIGRDRRRTVSRGDLQTGLAARRVPPAPAGSGAVSGGFGGGVGSAGSTGVMTVR